MKPFFASLKTKPITAAIFALLSNEAINDPIKKSISATFPTNIS